MNISFINDKVFYRFVEFTSRFVNYELLHEDYKLIALDKKEANNPAEKRVKRLANAFLFLLNQSNQVIDLEILQTSYYLLTQKRLSIKNASDILETIYKFKYDNIHFQAAKIIMFLSEFKFIRKIEYSLLIASYLLIRNGHYPLIFHESNRKQIKKIIKEKNITALHEWVYMNEFQNRNGIGSKENKGVSISLEELINFLQSHKNYFKTAFKINHMFIYGSFVKKTNHESSDLDILVDLSKELVGYLKEDTISKIQEFLTTELQTKVDVLDFGYSLRYSEIKEMNNTIKLF